MSPISVASTSSHVRTRVTMAVAPALPVLVTATGTPSVVGQTYGRAVAEGVGRQLQRWQEQVGRQGRSFERLIHEMNGPDGFRAAAADWAPGLLAEVEGIAEGAGVTSEEIFALNCLDEAWWWGGSAPGCSVMAFSRLGRSGAVGAQTMDLDAWMAGGQVALHIRDRASGPDLAVLTLAGMLGLCGANEHGVVVLVNALPSLPQSGSGLPVAFVLRSLLDCEDVQSAASFLQQVPHASGQAYTLVGPGGLIGFECDAVGARQYSGATPDFLLHTNHALEPRASVGANGCNGVTDSSQERLRILSTAVAGLHDVVGVRALLLDDEAGVCMRPGRWGRTDWATFGSLLVTLDPGVTVSITAGDSERPDVRIQLGQDRPIQPESAQSSLS